MNREVVERVRRAIYDTFASQGHPPSRQQVRDLAAVDEAQVNEAVAELAAQRHLALNQSGNVVMAHPFTTVNLGFSVMGERNLWWGGCAWDSFAIPNLVKDEPSVLVATTCPACRRPLAWTVTRAGPPEGPEVAHFLVPMDKVWNDVVYGCSTSASFVQRTACRTGSPAPATHTATSWISPRCGAWRPAGTADASTAPISARTLRAPPITSVASACRGPSGGSTTDVVFSRSAARSPPRAHLRTTSPDGSPLRHRVSAQTCSRRR